MINAHNQPTAWNLRDIEKPLRDRKARVYKVPDLFHESITDEQLDQIFAVMALTPQHTYQCLTKRPKRMVEYFCKIHGELRHDLGRTTQLGRQLKVESAMMRMSECPDEGLINWPLPNCWLGVTVEDQSTADKRIPLLLQTPAAVRFLSCEPMLESLDILSPIQKSWEKWIDFEGKSMFSGEDTDSGLGWAIVGGESGAKARPFDISWARAFIQQCKSAGIPVFMKQLGSNPWDAGARYSVTGKGGDPSEWPEDLRVREYPRAIHGMDHECGDSAA